MKRLRVYLGSDYRGGRKGELFAVPAKILYLCELNLGESARESRVGGDVLRGVSMYLVSCQTCPLDDKAEHGPRRRMLLHSYVN